MASVSRIRFEPCCSVGFLELSTVYTSNLSYTKVTVYAESFETQTFEMIFDAMGRPVEPREEVGDVEITSIACMGCGKWAKQDVNPS